MQIKNRFNRRKFTEQEAQQMLSHLKKLARRLRHTPTCNDINGEGVFNYHIYMACFGSIRRAQLLAGLKLNRRPPLKGVKVFSSGLVTKKMCLTDIKRIQSEVGSYPSYDELKGYGKYSFPVYLKHLGGMKWMKALPEKKSESTFNILV